MAEQILKGMKIAILVKRAREGECELGTLAIGKRCQERISATGWAW